MRTWQLQKAKARLSEVIEAAQRDGPQEIRGRGAAAVVVLSKAEYDRLCGRKPGFIEFIRGSPLVGSELDIERDRTPPRKLRL